MKPSALRGRSFPKPVRPSGNAPLVPPLRAFRHDVANVVWVVFGTVEVLNELETTRADPGLPALNAKTDAELQPFVQQTMQVADMEGPKVTPEALNAFRDVELPKMRAFLADKDARAKFEARLSAQYRSAYPLDEAWGETFGMLGLLWIVGGILGAAKLGMK